MSTEANGVLTPDENVEDQASETNEQETANVLTLKNRGQIKEFNLTDKEELQKLQTLAQQGWRAGEKNEELERKAQDADKWNTLLDQAKQGDDSAFNKVVGFVEQYTGRHLTREQKEQVQEELDNPFDNEFKQLREEITGLKTELKSRDEKAREQALNNRREELENKLLGMESDKNFPHFDYDEMVDEMNRTGNLDPVAVYRNLYFDKIMADASKNAKLQTEDIQKKREKGFVESGDSVGTPEKKVGRSRNLEEAFEKRISELEGSGKSIFK